VLEAVGVAVEVCSDAATLGLFDDAERRGRGWVTRCHDQPRTGALDMPGLLVDLSETPGVLRHGPVVVGRESRAVLQGFGLPDDRIDALIAEGVVIHTPEG
jgi:crotonobetainyl-CoA:carnitine CoA-transferase CaiB-like acyl-CoA transferase